MKKLFSDDLKGGLLLGIVATLCMFIPSMALIGAIIGFFGFRKSKRAVKSGKMLGLLGAILSLLPVLQILIALFTLAYLFTKH